MAGRVEGKVALVTGAARGQGRAHAVRLAEEGADIVAVDVCADLNVPYPSSTPEDLAETVALVEKLDRRIVSAQVDIRDLSGLRSAVDGAVAELGRLDVVVANAGICVPAMWDRVTPELFEYHQSVNVTGTWNTVMVAAPHLVAAGGGSVIITSSAAGITVQPFLVPYTTSKFAVRGMAKAFAVELGEHGIRVNSVHPCAVQTPMGGGGVLGIIGEALEAHPNLGGMFTNILPLEQAEPRDIANTVLFLASDESRFMTAHELSPDAGVTEY
ncbi:mycofactocin-coupled SDR family oxidoreductase [Pseudonocardia halophobica]|uniref:3-ketoacyl-ACP reductase n=1 Tax=Pseudonocardia halophobica TaxID=29401 RepID=A0A9W6NTY1_9PSEU|nr:mycofactocin-coupled SDR family oxidoreductase [Pseudonocardia halophobica]GLL09745.1 3-ketoacyl-ACP reductase [Pseudonocardia halophobica]